RRSDRILQAAAAPGQAVLRNGRDLARELPAEELSDGLSHPARVFHAAAAGIRRPGVAVAGRMNSALLCRLCLHRTQISGQQRVGALGVLVAKRRELLRRFVEPTLVLQITDSLDPL